MIYNWHLIADLDEFDDLEIPSMEYELIIPGVGLKTILLTKGTHYGLTYEGVFLPAGLNSRNPFEFEGHAAFIDNDNVIWLGIEVPEE